MRLFPLLIYWLYRIFIFLWRSQVVEDPDFQTLLKNKSPVILAHWHGDELALIHLVSRYKLATMTSTSKDGSIVDYIIHKLGGETSRGSSTRGGVSALKGLIRLCRTGRVLSLAVDGPRGPIYQPKAGVFELSKICGAQIVPVGVVAPHAYIFKKSWNRAYLPYPFSRFIVYFGKPLPAISRNQDSKDPNLSRELTQHLAVAKQHAAKLIAPP